MSTPEGLAWSEILSGLKLHRDRLTAAVKAESYAEESKHLSALAASLAHRLAVHDLLRDADEHARQRDAVLDSMLAELDARGPA